MSSLPTCCNATGNEENAEHFKRKAVSISTMENECLSRHGYSGGIKIEKIHHDFSNAFPNKLLISSNLQFRDF